MKKIIFAVIAACLLLSGCQPRNKENDEGTEDVSKANEIKEILVSHEWMYAENNDIIYSFNEDGTGKVTENGESVAITYMVGELVELKYPQDTVTWELKSYSADRLEIIFNGGQEEMVLVTKIIKPVSPVPQQNSEIISLLVNYSPWILKNDPTTLYSFSNDGTGVIFYGEIEMPTNYTVMNDSLNLSSGDAFIDYQISTYSPELVRGIADGNEEISLVHCHTDLTDTSLLGVWIGEGPYGEIGLCLDNYGRSGTITNQNGSWVLSRSNLAFWSNESGTLKLTTCLNSAETQYSYQLAGSSLKITNLADNSVWELTKKDIDVVFSDSVG